MIFVDNRILALYNSRHKRVEKGRLCNQKLKVTKTIEFKMTHVNTLNF